MNVWFFNQLEQIVHLFYFYRFSQWVSRVLKYPKKCLEDLTTFFMSTWWGDSKNMEKIKFSRWLFDGRLIQGKNMLPDGLNWLCYFAGSSKSHRENSISFIFFGFPSPNRHEHCFQILQTLFWVFQYSRNSVFWELTFILDFAHHKT